MVDSSSPGRRLLQSRAGVRSFGQGCFFWGLAQCLPLLPCPPSSKQQHRCCLLELVCVSVRDCLASFLSSLVHCCAARLSVDGTTLLSAGCCRWRETCCRRVPALAVAACCPSSTPPTPPATATGQPSAPAAGSRQQTAGNSIGGNKNQQSDIMVQVLKVTPSTAPLAPAGGCPTRQPGCTGRAQRWSNLSRSAASATAAAGPQ